MAAKPTPRRGPDEVVGDAIVEPAGHRGAAAADGGQTVGEAPADERRALHGRATDLIGATIEGRLRGPLTREVEGDDGIHGQHGWAPLGRDGFSAGGRPAACRASPRPT